MRKKNTFDRFLEVSGIKDDGRHPTAERAEYFVWYHTRATGETEVDLELISKYLKESGTIVPNLHELYDKIIDSECSAKAAPTPGWLRIAGQGLDNTYKKDVFESEELAPFYFLRRSNGEIIRIGSRIDVIKYWPQTHWIAAWSMLILSAIGVIFGAIGVFGIIVKIFK